MKRRTFIKQIGINSLALTCSGQLLADRNYYRGSPATIIDPVPGNTGANGRVVVVGGGMGGASVAKYLRHWGGEGVDVTLVDPRGEYYSNILSNLIIEGSRSLNDLTFYYDDLANKYGVRHSRKSLIGIDSDSQQIELNDGTRLPYDRLVLSPGIDFDTIPGLETRNAQDRVPHAWKAGRQSLLLRDQLHSMRAGGTFVLTIPPVPFRCPPGPYERACVVADFLRTNKPGAKVIVLDANPGIVAGVNNFTYAFNHLYKDVLEYHSSVELQAIDANRLLLSTSIGEIRADVINAIPSHRAADIIAETNLTDHTGRWAAVDMLTYESTRQNGIHVIGDASATTQPKAGHIANAEAKVCADAVIQSLKGLAPNPVPMTNSSCYTPITHDKASWLSVVYRYDPLSKTMKPSGAGVVEANTFTRENYQEMLEWFENLMLDSFA